MENQLLLDRLAEKIRQCQACSLHVGTTQAVPGEGPAGARIFFIGEGPGFYEDKTGRPFVGRAGQLLEQTLNKVGLKREEVFIGNVVKHRPPENRDPSQNEIAACGLWLDQQLEIIRPKVVVTLGRFSMYKFFPGAKISFVHGVPKKIKDKIVIPMYHPAAALRSTSMLQAFQADFEKNKEILLKPDAANLPSEDGEKDDDSQIGLFN